MIQETYPIGIILEPSSKVFVNCEGIEVEPSYRTNISGYSIKTITGTWVKKEER